MTLYQDMVSFNTALPKTGRLLGFDLGTKTIGLAMSDAGRQIATPLETLKKGKFSKDLISISALIEKHGIQGLVIGLPMNMDGTQGARAQATRAFARNLDTHLALPLVYWDERLSTAAVTRTLIDADRSRARRQELVDKMAASYILQGALDRLRNA
jgi:putative Holliday junction resolvase